MRSSLNFDFLYLTQLERFKLQGSVVFYDDATGLTIHYISRTAYLFNRQGLKE